MTNFALLLDSHEREKLDALAERFGVSRAEILRILLRAVDLDKLHDWRQG